MRNLFENLNLEKRLFRYLVKELAPVLCGVKPTLLICFSKSSIVDKSNFFDIWNDSSNELTRDLPLEYIILKKSHCGVQVLFYDRVQLAAILADEKIRNFLNENGYTQCLSIECFLLVLKNKFESGTFPHEIGVFLGYPLKDVLGFIENGPQEAVACGRWKVYGDACDSLSLMQSYELAENLFKLYFQNDLNPLEKIDYLKLLVN